MASIAAGALLVLEAIGTIAMWAPIPVAWFWVGGRVFVWTGSLLLSGGVTFVGILATVVVAMSALTRLDAVWVALRRRAGHEQREGALTQVVVASATVAVAAFWVWFHIIEKAFVIPFMPTT